MTISDENREFVNFLFDKLVSHVDTAMLDLHDDDACVDHIQMELLCD
jgi:tRNA A58 N-methylase Trm61